MQPEISYLRMQVGGPKKPGPCVAGALIATALLLGGAPILAHVQRPDQPVAASEQVFARCAMCHQVGPFARVGLGPPLNGIIGRRAGSFDRFGYSDALKTSGIVWTEDELKAFLRNPKGRIPGMRMVFPGIKDEAKLEALIRYLREFDEGRIADRPRTP